MKEKINPRLSALFLFMIGVAAIRIPNAAHYTWMANFTPIGAMALFGGSYFKKPWKAFAFPLLTLFLSDLVICNVVFDGRYGFMYGGWYVVYGIFSLIVLLGKLLIQKVTVKNVLLASVFAALGHWFISDFTVWLGGGTDMRTMAPLSKNWQGLIQCYVQGFPFMKKFLTGTLVYSGLMFGLFEWMKAEKPAMVLAKS